MENAALDIAIYLTGLAQYEYKDNVSNQRLQKLLYVAQEKYVEKYNEKLYLDNINEWLPESKTETKPITIGQEKYDKVCSKLSNKCKDYLNNFYKTYRLLLTGDL